MSDDVNCNNSHCLPTLLIDCITLWCHTAHMLYIIADKSNSTLAVTLSGCCISVLVRSNIGFPELESPFKQNATIVPQRGKLLSVKKGDSSLRNVLQPPDAQAVPLHHSVALRTIWSAFKYYNQQLWPHICPVCYCLDQYLVILLLIHSEGWFCAWLFLSFYPSSTNRTVAAYEII